LIPINDPAVSARYGRDHRSSTEKIMSTNPPHGQGRHLKTASTALIASTVALLAACTSGQINRDTGGENLVAGRAYALRTCAQCHNVTDRAAHPLATVGAPDFYAVANAKTTSHIGLNAFLMTPHPTMPNLIIADEDRRNVIAYILSMRLPKPGPDKI
jgi:mono/diheme cytochrome c family protein